MTAPLTYAELYEGRQTVTPTQSDLYLTVPADRGNSTALADSAGLLDRTAAFLERFVVFASAEQRDAVALWIMHAHAFGAAETTPRLSVRSAEKRCGKTRLLECLDLLAPSPVRASDVSVSYLFRRIHAGRVTLLLDEADAIFKQGAREREDLRALLNAGYRTGAVVGRVAGEGKAMEPKEFSAFCPVVLGGIGTLPDTIEDRAILITLRRKTTAERVDRFRFREVAPVAGELCSDLASWAETAEPTLAEARPVLPDVLDDRKQDCWEPLLAIAELAGPAWTQRARSAALVLAAEGVADEQSRGVQLLADIRRVFGKDDRLHGETLVERLCRIEESPWGDDRYRLNARWLARKLKPFGIRPQQLWIDETNRRGYRADDFAEAWTRYLPTPEMSARPLEPLGPNATNGNGSSGQAALAVRSGTDDLGAWCSDNEAIG